MQCRTSLPSSNEETRSLLCARMSWLLPVPGQDNVRRDVNKGTEGVVEGWADPENHKLILKVLLKVEPGGAPREVVHKACPWNVQLTSEYLEEIGALLEEGADASVEETSGDQALSRKRKTTGSSREPRRSRFARKSTGRSSSLTLTISSATSG